MFFEIKNSNKKDLDQFTYMLCKNPHNNKVYEKNYKENCKAQGKYINGDTYQIVVQNSIQHVITLMKKNNEPFYVTEQFDGITPYNLIKVYDILRSAIAGVGYPDELKEKVHNKVKQLEVKLGPFTTNYDHIKEVFESFNLQVNKIDDLCTNNVFSLHITGKKISVIEMLQKVYFLSFYLTFQCMFFRYDKSQIEKALKLSKNWLGSCKDKTILKRILRKVTQSNKDIMKYFIENFKDLKSIKEKDLKDELYIDFTSLNKTLKEKVLTDYFQKDYPVIVDYGCGEGSFVKKIASKCKKSKIYAIDKKDKKYYLPNVSRYQMNLLIPDFNVLPLNPDMLVLIEVIEHLDKDERHKILDLILNTIQPKEFIMTTPNHDFNKYYDMTPGTYRHRGHLIEFNKKSLQEEVINYLEQNKYTVKLDGVCDPNIKRKKLSTFILHAKRDKEFTDVKLNKFKSYYTDEYLPISNYYSSVKELSNGYSSKQFITNVKAIPYLQPTIAPVDYQEIKSENIKYLEHPQTAFKYFKDRGITEIVSENKMMGSNAQIIIFKNEQTANAFGLDKLIYINSRKGYKFFYDDQEGYNEMFYKQFRENMEYDFYVLNGEMMPWSFKAKGLIDRQFKCPIEATLMKSRYMNDEVQIEKANKFLKSLANYDGEYTPQFHIFDLLACGNFNGKKLSYVNGIHINNIKKHEYYDKLENENIKIIKSNLINLNSLDILEEYNNWKILCEAGFEGRVYKPVNKINYTESGYLIQPALKVRGREYLRLIYGMNYLDDTIFEMLIQRGTKYKRIQSIQQFEISQRILSTFLKGTKLYHNKYVAFFIGNENVNFKNSDATL